MPRSDPTLYEKTYEADWSPKKVTVVKSRAFKHRWWAFDHVGDRSLYAPTFARVLELAQKEWGS